MYRLFLGNVEAAPEDITVDKWFQERPNPVLRKTLTGAVLAGSFFFFNPESVTANDKVPDWHPQTNQPQRLVSKLPRQHTGEFRFEVPRTILLTDWFQEIRQPYFTKRREVNTGEFRFEVPRTILLSDWWQPVQQPYFSKRRDYHTGETRFEVPRQILLSDWWQQSFNPVLRKVIRQQGEYQRPDIVADDTQLNEWYQPASEPYFSKRRNYFTGEFRFETPRAILISDWYAQYFNPTRRKEIRQAGTAVKPEFFQAPEELTLDKWFRPASEPYFTKRRILPSGEARFEVPRTVLITDWWQSISQPVLRKVQRQQGEYNRIDPLADDTQLNEWWQPAQEPYFSKRRFYLTGEFRFEVPRVILISDWFREILQPLKQRFQTSGGFTLEVPRPPLILDWLQHQPIPKRLRQVGGEIRLEILVPEEVTLDKWFMAVVQPYIRRVTPVGAHELKIELSVGREFIQAIFM